jgi:hypothetical protein
MDLQGDSSVHASCKVCFVVEQCRNAFKFSQFIRKMASDSLPPELREVIQEFKDLFQATETLPPRRQHDHRIPLITGA